MRSAQDPGYLATSTDDSREPLVSDFSEASTGTSWSGEVHDEEQYEEMTVPQNLYGSFISAIGLCERELSEHDHCASRFNAKQSKLLAFQKFLLPTATGLFLNYSIQWTFFSIVRDIVNSRIDEDPDCMAANHFLDTKSSIFLTVYALTIFCALQDWLNDVKVVMFGQFRVTEERPGRFRLSCKSRCICVVCVLLPEFLFFIALLILGSKFIMISPDMETMMLNCSALAFIQTCDEIIYQSRSREMCNEDVKMLITDDKHCIRNPRFLDNIYSVCYLTAVTYYPNLFMWYYVSGSASYMDEGADESAASGEFMISSYPISCIISVLGVVFGFVLVCTDMSSFVSKLLSCLGFWRCWVKSSEITGKVCCQFSETMMNDPARASIGSLYDGSLAYGIYEKQRSNDNGTKRYIMVEQLCRPKNSIDAIFKRPEKDTYMLESSGTDRQWRLTKNGKELAKTTGNDGDCLPQVLTSSSPKDDTVFQIVDEEFLFKCSTVQSVKRWQMELNFLLLCLFLFVSQGWFLLPKMMFFNWKQAPQHVSVPSSDVTANPIMLGPGGWHFASGCPLGLHPCELDTSICIDLGVPKSGTHAPIGSAHSTWCPIRRSRKSCVSLNWNHTITPASRAGRVAVDFCSSIVAISSASDLETLSATDRWMQTCSGVGARLCRPSELDSAQGTGWSSEPCAVGSYWRRGVDGKWVCAQIDDSVHVDADDAFCCADNEIGAWPCAREPSGHTCTFAPCSEAIGPTHCIPAGQQGSFCRCDEDHCEHDGRCVLPTESLLLTQARPQMRERRTSCHSDRLVGAFLSYKGCGAEVKRQNGSAFSFDTSQPGWCYMETASSTTPCPDGARHEGTFDFYVLSDEI